MVPSTFHHFPIHRPFVSQPLGGEAVVEVVVDGVQLRPEAEEALAQLAVVVFGEVAEETVQHLTLFVGKETAVVQLMQVGDVGQHLVGICQLLVDVVEIGQQQLSPAIEMIQRLVDARHRCERLVQLANQLDGVGHTPLGEFAEQVADGGIGRAPDGLAGQAHQVLVEEERGTLVGKDDGEVRQVGAVFAEDILSHIFQEGLHTSMISFL